MDMDPEFTGDDLNRLIVDIEAAVGRNRAGLTPLGVAVTQLCEDSYRANNHALKEGKDEPIERFCKRMKNGTCDVWLPDDGPACPNSDDEDCQVGIWERQQET